jgi:hypothetical protein
MRPISANSRPSREVRMRFASVLSPPQRLCSCSGLVEHATSAKEIEVPILPRLLQTVASHLSGTIMGGDQLCRC